VIVKPTVIQLTRDDGIDIWVSVARILQFDRSSARTSACTRIVLVPDITSGCGLHVRESASQVHALIEGQTVTGGAA
jgi:hypothetical protein